MDTNINDILSSITEERLAKVYRIIADDLQYKQRKPIVASEFYLKAIDLKPNYVKALNSYAQNLRLGIKDYQEAIKYYTKVIDLNPKYEYALSRRGMCKGLLGDFKGQIEDYSKVIEFEPSCEHYISRILIKMKINDHLGVIEDCTYLIDEVEQSSCIYKYRGESKAALADYEGALQDYEVALEMIERPSSSMFGVLTGCGNVKLEIGDFEGALEVFEKLIQYYPEHPMSFKLRADAKFKLGDIKGFNEDVLKFKQIIEEYKEKYGFSPWK